MSSTVVLSGTLNFRDVGGVPVGVDRQIAFGRLFRSDTLQFLTAEDVAILVDTVGLRTDIDLRLDFELDVEGRGLLGDADVELAHLPFHVAGANRPGSATPILRAEDPVVSHYVDYLGHSPQSVAGLITVLGQPHALPALVHCAAGKDRTGIAVAMVLAAVGCTYEDIATEYAAGSHLIPAVMERLSTMVSYGESLAQLPPDARLTPPEYIERFFIAVTATYGGPIDYLRSHGITDADLQALSDALTEPVPPTKKGR
jgi:protein-tyrosine phosphatase